MTTGNIGLFDTHCHFDFEPFSSDPQTHLNLCSGAGVSKLLIPATGAQNWQPIQALSAKYPRQIYYALGFHPYFLTRHPSEADWAELQHHLQARDPNCLAIGECGLDGMIEIDANIQQQVLLRQIDLANQFKLPLILHSRKTHSQLIALIKRCRFNYGGVLHGFSGSEQQAQEFIQLGFKIGVGGVITYPRANKTRNAIANLPVESLVLETDAPDMPLNGYQGEPNHPQRLGLVLDELATLKQMEREQLTQQLWQNSLDVFGL